MNKLCRKLTALFGGCLAVQAAAQEAPFLQWNIEMSTPRLQSGAVVKMKNLNWGQYVAFKGYAKIDVTSPGINLQWIKKAYPTDTYSDIRFEIQNPGKVTPALGPVSFDTPVAIRVSTGQNNYGGYLVNQSKRLGVDMDFSRTPSYEWRVINFASAAEGITRTQKIALLNTKKKAFLVYQSRRIGFEVGWWEYVPPGKGPKIMGQPVPGGKKPNDAQIRPYLNALVRINEPQQRFLRRFLGVGYEYK